jgi:hypothetical protein
MQEELDEVYAEALSKRNIDKDKLISECFDLIQATWTAVFLFVDDETTLKEHWLIKHLRKLEHRDLQERIVIEKYIEL